MTPAEQAGQVSVCLLTYNHAHLIQSTIRSILNQSIDDIEIIISDDRSTDGTYELILEMASTDRRIIAVQTQQNLGMAGNANFAASLANRPYIALLHHDDLYRPDLLEAWLSVAKSDPDIAYVFNAYGVHNSDFVYRSDLPSGRIDGAWFLKSWLFPNWSCAVRGTALVRRRAWLEVGGMRPQFGLLADIDLWMRLSRRWPVGYVPEPVIVVRQERPEAYPEEYVAGEFNWARQKHLYQIHAVNRLEYLDLDTLSGRSAWWKFRLWLGLETMKWLAYAVVRRKPSMIRQSIDGATDHDLTMVKFVRGVLRTMVGSADKVASN